MSLEGGDIALDGVEVGVVVDVNVSLDVVVVDVSLLFFAVGAVVGAGCDGLGRYIFTLFIEGCNDVSHGCVLH